MTNHTTEHSTHGAYVNEGEEFNRDTTYIEDRIVADPAASTDGEHQLWAAEAGTYPPGRRPRLPLGKPRPDCAPSTWS